MITRIKSYFIPVIGSRDNSNFTTKSNTIECYERTRDQGTLGSIAIAIVEPLGGHLFMYLIGHVGKPPRGGSAPTNIT
jgi:hypothetical protein